VEVESVWLHIRAVFVTLHLLVITLMALPTPEGGLDRASWQDPTVQDELTAWTHTLNRCGIDVTREALEDWLWTLAVRYVRVRHTVFNPVSPYNEACGTGQSWCMFVAPHRYPTLLHIDIEEGGSWRPVYIERSDEHTYLSRELDSYRFRSVIFRFGWPGFEDDLERFARWVQRRATQDFPNAERVRVRLFKSRTRSPEEVRDNVAVEGEFVRTVELPLRAMP